MVRLQDALVAGPSPVEVGAFFIQPRRGGVLHRLQDDGGLRRGVDGKVGPQVRDGPRVIQVGVGEQKPPDMPGVRRAVQQPPLQGRGEQGVVRAVPIEPSQAGEEPQGQQVPQAEGAAGGQELGEVLIPAAEGTPEIQEEGLAAGLQEQLVAADLPPAAEDMNAKPAHRKGSHRAPPGIGG
jgi:hypothetical protein